MASEKATPSLETVSAAIPKELADRVREAADREDRSVSNWIRRMIQAALRREPENQ
jgi:metal-responsive CopG/Arc/MetJ family transcriptional regulator